MFAVMKFQLHPMLCVGDWASTQFTKLLRKLRISEQLNQKCCRNAGEQAACRTKYSNACCQVQRSLLWDDPRSVAEHLSNSLLGCSES